MFYTDTKYCLKYLLSLFVFIKESSLLQTFMLNFTINLKQLAKHSLSLLNSTTITAITGLASLHQPIEPDLIFQILLRCHFTSL
jgi:hypothetical protein